MPHKAGFVNIIGNPNVGKSTLMNALVGEKLSIITPKAQTTRRRIIGIVNGEDHQVVFSDTPGIIDPHYKLQEYMMKEVQSAFVDADILLLIVEAGEKKMNDQVAEKIRASGTPLIVAINKIDISDQASVEARYLMWHEQFPEADIIPISALLRANIDTLFEKILGKLPEGPPYYPKDTLTDKNTRFFISEIIREKILLYYKKEVPYSVEVAIDQFKESDTITHISAFIFVARESQKAIILGHQGNAIKRMATEARKDMEKWLGTKVFLELIVKVKKDWRDSDTQLKQLGYDQQ